MKKESIQQKPLSLDRETLRLLSQQLKLAQAGVCGGISRVDTYNASRNGC